MATCADRIPMFSCAVLIGLGSVESAGEENQSLETQFDSIIEQMNQGSSQAFSDAIDADALLTRVFDRLEVEPALKARFSSTITRGVPQLAENIRKRMPEGAYARVLRVRNDGNKATALVRYGYGNDRFGYHEYDLEADVAGNARIVDWMDYLEGERYSAALRRSVVAYRPTVAAVRGLVPEHEGSEEEYARLAEVMTAYRDRDFQKFYDQSATLSRNLRRTKFMHLLTCEVSRMSRDRNLYIEAYRDLSNNFGDDPTVVLPLLSYYFSKGDYDDVTASLRLLQEALGVRDAALLALMSRTALGLRNADEAAILADEAISIEPGLETAYWAALGAHVRLRNYSFAVMTAKSLEQQFGKSLSRDQFEDNAMYAEFVKSPQYKRWQAGKE